MTRDRRNKRPHRPALERVYFTADIGRMAAARSIGGVLWAEDHRGQRGILLWEDLDDAATWQIGLAGRPTVVVEIPVVDIDRSLLEPALAPDYQCSAGRRTWIYPDAIAFSTVRWHTYRTELAEPAQVYRIDIPTVPGPDPGTLPQGIITLDT